MFTYFHVYISFTKLGKFFLLLSSQSQICSRKQEHLKINRVNPLEVSSSEKRKLLQNCKLLFLSCPIFTSSFLLYDAAVCVWVCVCVCLKTYIYLTRADNAVLLAQLAFGRSTVTCAKHTFRRLIVMANICLTLLCALFILVNLKNSSLGFQW